MDRMLYIAHHGILGQKWGVRRYQNEDGTRTAAGKRKAREARQHEDYKRAHDKKPVSEMSDTELKNRTKRLQQENQYEQLRRSQNKGYQAVTNTAKIVGGVAGFLGSAAAIVAIGMKIANKYNKTPLPKNNGPYWDGM